MNYTEHFILTMRGGHPDECDFCDQPFNEERRPEPEEAGQWACTECLKRWGRGTTSLEETSS